MINGTRITRNLGAFLALTVAALGLAGTTSHAGGQDRAPAAEAAVCSLASVDGDVAVAGVDGDDGTAAQPYLIQCYDSDDCAPGWYCNSNGVCMRPQPECTTNIQCGPDGICYQGRCVAV